MLPFTETAHNKHELDFWLRLFP